MNRKDILNSSIQCTCVDRQKDYGDAYTNFSYIAGLWKAYCGFPFKPEDVSIMMALLKIARMMGGKHKDDNYIDAAAYIAMAGEIAKK